MKQAISYIRISNKDQSNFSLSGQTEYIKNFCERKNISIVGSFLDNGQSAKNFDRADWKRLESFVKDNHKNIDHLIVVKYDRFSRNVSEGLNMIDKLEKKYNISILSVFEEIAINPSSPFFFKMRTDMLVQAEFELRVIRDRTKFGIDQAKREGRWVTRAPYGYLNQRDGKNKPQIVIDPGKAEVVKKMYELFINGSSIYQTKLYAEKLGYSQRSHSAATRVLKNPVYVGLLKLDGQLVKGSHEPIIDMVTFNKAQSLFKKESKIKVVINDEVPLRGVLRCECGRLLTAGKTKGKTKYYWYYKCKSHLEVNLNGEKINEQIRQVMFDLSLSEQTIDSIKMRAETLLKEKFNKRQGNVTELKKRLKEIEAKILSVEEKFIANHIDYKVYSSWNSAYNTELNQLKSELLKATDRGQNVWEIYHRESSRLTNMKETYDTLSTPHKQRLLNLVFNRGLMYRLNSFLTNNIMDIFTANQLEINKKGLLIINSPSDNPEEITISSGNGSLVELFELLKTG